MRALRFLSVLILFAVASQVSAQIPASPKVELFELESKVLGETRSILVRTPANSGAADRYPVLYLTDGDRQISHLSSVVEFLAREGRMPEMILVGIVNTDRNRDLTPTSAPLSMPDGRTIDIPNAGGAAKFLSFIETELIPWVEGRYPVTPLRIFAGHSFGGLFAVHSFVSRPGLFRATIAVSPTFTWDDGLIEKSIAKALQQQPEGILVITLGDEGAENAKAFRSVETLLAKKAPKSLHWEMAHFEGEDHGSVVLPSHYQGLRTIFDGWRAPDTMSVTNLEAHYKSLSRRLGYDIEVPEQTLNLAGYRLLGQGKLDEAIAIFERNRDTYPDSPNVHDSLGEAYESAGRLEDARASYSKATVLGEARRDPNLATFRQNLERMEKASGNR